MKVLWLANIPSPYRVDFFNELGKHCDLTVLFERRTSSERDKSWGNINSNGFKAIYLPGKQKGAAEAFCPSVVKYLTREYDKIVVTTFSDPTGILAVHTLKRRKIPYFLESDGAFPGGGKGVKEWLKKRIISGADLYFSTANLHDEYYIQYGADPSKIVRYPFTSIFDKDVLPSVPTSEEKARIRKELGMAEDKIALAVGQFIYRKGYDVLIKAMSGCDNLGVYIVGGEVPEDYETLKNDLHAYNVHFVPFKLREELREYYMAADVFVHPTREDIWGLVINEAMAKGLPIVTTDKCIAGLELVQNGQNGIIIKDLEAVKLRDAVMYVMDNPKMGTRSLNTISEYTIEKMAKCHLQILKNKEANNAN